ncbi:protease complex subunit PrcB family protein [Marinobacter fonticola]|uniref:protease complex subunit PrcB family protein n=1 Tax=Marinobacter fonticola TaxID=2603215 RepID=UPI0011E67D66|nr:protease complex subunit PrcB family protein [Marinobacter fonticola]
MKFARAAAGLLASQLLLTGCTSMSSASHSVTEEVRPVASLAHCGLTAPGLVLVENAAQWQKLSSSLGAQLPAWPEESDHWLMVASLGQQRTGGYGVDFENAGMDGHQLKVSVKVRRPAADAMVTQALTTPCIVFELPSTGWKTVTVAGEAPFPISREHP